MGTRKRQSAVRKKTKFLPVDVGDDEARLEFVGRLKEKDIKTLRRDPRWLVVGREGMKAHILYFAEPSEEHGIDGGRISKLEITDKDKKQLVIFDRGWDIEPPKSGKAREFYEDIMGCE